MKRLIKRAFDQAAGPAFEVCSKCLGPYRGRLELPTVVVREGEPVPHCAECGELTFLDGRTAVAMGPRGPSGVIVILEGSRDPVPDKPGAQEGTA
jgi:hypothetical protein